MLWAHLSMAYIGIPDDGGIVVVDAENPADMSGVRCYAITRDLDEKFVGYWVLSAVREDGSTEQIARDLCHFPNEAIEKLKRLAEEHDSLPLKP
ncbi:MAG: hypothetical protein V4671_21065 [Armatimonadota bacterium]